MRCRIHASDSTSTVGVCATCLRHRLLSLIAAQSHRSLHHLHAASPRRKSDFDHHQQPFLFPRSVSPYVPRGSKLHHEPLPEPRFYSTPQIGHPPPNHNHRGRFSFISSLFRPRSDKSDFGLRLPRDPRETASTATTTFSSSSWFSSIRRKHKSKPPKTTSGDRLPRGVVVLDRGMTPERMSCADGSEFDEPRIDFMSDSCKRTPARSAKPGSNMSGMAFCMSPLVRASPARLWNQKSAPTDIVGYSGEIRSVGYPNLSTASSYCANRSRKLADFGRVSHHH